MSSQQKVEMRLHLFKNQASEKGLDVMCILEKSSNLYASMSNRNIRQAVYVVFKFFSSHIFLESKKKQVYLI